jgi:hypothetical protein
MSKFAIGTQAENVADHRRSAIVVAAFPAVDGSSGHGVEARACGARRPVTGARLTFILARRGAA